MPINPFINGWGHLKSSFTSVFSTAEISAIQNRCIPSLKQEALNIESALSIYEKQAQNLSVFILKLIEKNSQCPAGPHSLIPRTGSDAHEYWQQKNFLIMDENPPISEKLRNLLDYSELFEFLLKIFYQKDENVVFATIIFTEVVSKDAKKFFTSGYPWTDPSILPDGFDLSAQPFFYINDPEHNPERKTKWTDPYDDPLCRGRMVSCCHPIYFNDEFLGVVELDITLENMKKNLMSVLLPKNGCSLIITPYGEIIKADADSTELGKYFMSLSRFDECLLEHLKSRPDDIHEFDCIGKKYYVIASKIKNLGWSIVRIIPSLKKCSFDPSGCQTAMSLIEISRSLSMIVPAGKQISRVHTEKISKANSVHEMAQLAHAFDDVAEKLKKREQQLKLASKKLSQSERLESISRLSAAIIHEISNPLSTISSYTQILMKKTNIDPCIRQLIQTIGEETERISSHIHSLLSLSRDTEPELRFVNFDEFIEKCISVYIKIGVEHHIHIEKDLSPVGVARFDPGKLYEAITNIMFNAFDAIEHDGCISLKTRLVNGHDITVPYQIRGTHETMILIEIADSGPGIPVDLLNKIFDPFFSTKPAGKGTGMGLPIAMKTIEGHDGALMADNWKQGAVFRIYLPLIAHMGNQISTSP